MSRLYVYADDSMQGREAGQLGDFKATTYIAAEAKRMGLVPAGDSGTYFQTIPYKTRALDSTSTFTVAGAPLAFRTDFIPSGGDATKLESVGVVYAGDLGDTARRDLTDQEVTGKLVVFTASAGLFRQARRPPRVKGAATARSSWGSTTSRPSSWDSSPAPAGLWMTARRVLHRRFPTS